MYFFFFEINSLSSTELAELVKSRALGAAFNSPNHQTVPRCLPGTRTEVLKAIKDCIDGEKSKQICWLYGLAGSGKYTVNLTLADYYADERRLAGSFSSQRKIPNLIISTISSPHWLLNLSFRSPTWRLSCRRPLKETRLSFANPSAFNSKNLFSIHSRRSLWVVLRW